MENLRHAISTKFFFKLHVLHTGTVSQLNFYKKLHMLPVFIVLCGCWDIWLQ